MGDKQYERLRYIGDNATPDIMDALDRGERSIRGVYDELYTMKKAMEETPELPFQASSPPEPSPVAAEPAADAATAAEPPPAPQTVTRPDSPKSRTPSHSSRRNCDPAFEKLTS